MTIEKLREVTQTKPFRPFVVHLADGRSIPVLSPEFIWSVPSGRTILICQPDDTLNMVDLLLVTDLEFKPVANGSGRKRKS